MLPWPKNRQILVGAEFKFVSASGLQFKRGSHLGGPAPKLSAG